MTVPSLDEVFIFRLNSGIELKNSLLVMVVAQGDCDYECNSGNEPVCDQCVCNDLEDFCVRTFKYFKMMLQECQNDIHSLTSDEINMLLDPSTTPEELCQYEDQC